jgi:hypothetical protein
MQLEQSLVNHLNELLPIISNKDLNIIEVTTIFKNINLLLCRESNNELKGYYSSYDREGEGIYFKYDKHLGWIEI